MPRLPRAFFRRDPVTVARALLGQRLVRIMGGQRLAGIIVETEAYLGVPDRAAHTCNGRHTPRNHSMWLDGGTAYIYFTYGMHFCLNVVTQAPGIPTAVLLRALEPTEGLDRMTAHRTKKTARISPTTLCAGPARLCQALHITRELDGTDLCTGETLFIEQVRRRAYSAHNLAVTPRIGVAYAGAWAQKPLRFYLRNNPHVSRP